MKQYRVPEPESLKPTVSISVKGNKLKVYPGNTVYLKNGTEFELFFENPTADNYKAEIIINGEAEHSGLVLNPGKRFRLERFMDTDKKFLFDVYKVDNNDVVKEIIKDNGSVVVNFYKEYKANIFTTYPWITWSNGHTGTPGNFYNGTINATGGTIKGFNMANATFTSNCCSANGSTQLSYNSVISNNMNIRSQEVMDSNIVSCASVNEPKQVETGRVEEGSDSDQKFVTVNMQFNSWVENSVSFKMLPESQKPTGNNVVSTQDVRSYCKCGRRVKQGNNYCAGCGRKL